jgi:hypothetical protein
VRESRCCGNLEVIGALKVQPEGGAGIEVPGERQSRVRDDAAALVDDAGHTRHRDAEVERQPVHEEVQWLHEIGTKNFTG